MDERRLTDPDRRLAAHDANEVYRVVRLVTSHPDGWEAATAAGVAELAKTIPELERAQVASLATVVSDGAIAEYRVGLEATYRIDRRRRDRQGQPTQVRRHLVVANRTLLSPGLEAALAERVAQGPAEFHILAPQSTDGWNLDGAMADPVAGYVPVDLETVTEMRRAAFEETAERLGEQLARLHEAGVTATGEIGPGDPLNAVAAVLDRGSFDEVVVCTLPAPVSRWLRLDLGHRLERRFGLRVSQVDSGEG